MSTLTLDEIGSRLEHMETSVEEKLDRLTEGLQKLEASVGRMAGEANEAAQRQAVATDRYERETPEIKARLTDLEKEVADLDRWRARAIGFMLGAAALGGGVAGALTHFLGGK